MRAGAADIAGRVGGSRGTGIVEPDPGTGLLLDVLADCGSPRWYYRLRDRFPLRTGIGYQPARENMLAAWAATGVPITKPARRMQIATQRAQEITVSVSTSTYRYGGTIVVTAGLATPAGSARSDLAILARELLLRAGEPTREPPYPRPEATTDRELQELTTEVAGLLPAMTSAAEARRT